MTEAEFHALAAKGYTHIPVVLETFADLDTPLSVYLKLANEPYSYLLESVQGGERFGRYSVIGLPARSRIEVRGSDSLQALALACDIDHYLRGLERQHGFEFFWDDGSAYFQPQG